MCYAETNWKKVFINTAVGVLRSPSGRVLKQADCPDATIVAEVEPMECAARNANQIAGFHFNREHGAGGRVNVKQSSARDNESHFIFVVPVFAIEFCEHRIETRG